jgi:hypothetical protein
MVLGEEDREMELEKQSQGLGGEFSARLTSGPSCMWAGTTWRGLESGREKVASPFSPTSREYPGQYIWVVMPSASVSRRQVSIPAMAAPVWVPVWRAEALPVKSMLLDKCDDCDSAEPLDLFELTLDIACPPRVTGAVLDAVQLV